MATKSNVFKQKGAQPIKKKPVISPVVQPQDPTAKRAVKFNADSSVDVTTGGKTERLTQEQYKDFQARQTGGASGVNALSPDQKVKEAVNRGVIDTTIKQKIVRGESLSEDEKQRVLSLSQPLDTNQTDKLAQDIQANKSEVVQSPLGQGLNVTNALPQITDTLKAGLQPTGAGVLSGTANLLSQSSIVAPQIQNAAQVYDALRSALTSTKQTDQKVAEQGFTDAIASINSDIKEVAAGRKEGVQALQSFYVALDSLSALESSQKGLGKANLRYWQTNGKEVERMIITNKIILENLRQQLLAEMQNQLIAKASAEFGTR